MIEDISFPKNLSKVSRNKRVKRTTRQTEEKQKRPFQKYLNQHEDPLKDSEEGQDPDKEKSKLNSAQTDDENAAAPTADKPNEPEHDSQGKRIDVHA